MAAEQSKYTADQLRDCLQRLTQEQGIWRTDMDVFLAQAGMYPLVETWNVNVKAGPDVARESLRVMLAYHLAKVIPQSEKKKFTERVRIDRYRKAVAVSFNIISGKTNQEFCVMDLEERRRVLVDYEQQKAVTKARELGEPIPKRGVYSKSSCQRDLNNAISQIISHLQCSDYQVPDVSQSASGDVNHSHIAHPMTESDPASSGDVSPFGETVAPSDVRPSSSDWASRDNAGTEDSTDSVAEKTDTPSLPLTSPSRSESHAFFDRALTRLRLEWSAIVRRVSLAARKVSRQRRQAILVATAMIVFWAVFGWQGGSVEVTWFDPFRTISTFITDVWPMIVLLNGLIMTAAVSVHLSDISKRWKVFNLALCAFLVAMQLGTIVAVRVARSSETIEYGNIRQEIHHWLHQYPLAFSSGKSSQSNVCTDVRPYLFMDESLSDTKIIKRLQPQSSNSISSIGETNYRLCELKDGVLTLGTSTYYGGTNASRGVEYLGPKADFYMQVVLQPEEGTAWTDCGIAVLPDDIAHDRLAHVAYPSLPNFRLEADDEVFPMQYHPVVSLSVDEDVEPIAARSAITLPYEADGNFADSPLPGWLKYGLLRRGNRYTFFVNDRSVLEYTWRGGPVQAHASVQTHVPVGSDRMTGSGCRFEGFEYWTKPQR